MIKNAAGQKLAVFAWDSLNGVPKTGDAANIIGQISKDGGASTPTNDTNPTELDATNHPGIYVFDLTQAETNADLVLLTPKSATAAIVFRPVIAYPTNWTPTAVGYLNAPVGSIPTNPLLANDTRLNNLDAAISTRSTATQGATKAELDAARAAIQADIPDISALAQEASVQEVKARTDLLPADPASESGLEAAIRAIPVTDLTTIETMVRRLLGLNQENYYLDQPVYNSNGRLTAGRLRLYSAAGSVGTDDDVLATYTVTSTWLDNLLMSYAVVKT